jgi:hypothetical protein
VFFSAHHRPPCNSTMESATYANPWRLGVRDALKIWSDCCWVSSRTQLQESQDTAPHTRRSGQWRIGKAKLLDRGNRSVAPEVPNTGQWRRKWPHDRAIVGSPGPWFASLGLRLSWVPQPALPRTNIIPQKRQLDEEHEFSLDVSHSIRHTPCRYSGLTV